MRSDELEYRDCVHAAGAASVANSWTLASLRVLNFDSHYLGDAGLIDLAGSSNADQLVELDLSFNDIGTLGEGAYEAVVRSRHLGRLRRLNLAGNAVTHLAAQVLADWPRAAAMEWIDLRQTALDARARRLIEALPFTAKFLLDDPAPESA